jgi:hypothetical protein
VAEYSYPYDAGAGTTVDEAFWRAMTARFLGSGVIGSGVRDATDPSLKVTLGSGGAGPTFQMASGEAWQQGIKYVNDAALSKVAANNANSSPRIDRLALKLDTTANTMAAVIVQGTPSGTPVSPLLPDTASALHLPIGRATCPGSASAQNYSNFVDERSFVGTRHFVGPSTAVLPPMQQGDTWLQSDTREALEWVGGKLVGTRQKVYGGVTIGSTGTYSPPANVISTFARIDIDALPYDYWVTFSAHLQVGGLGNGNYVVGTVREMDVGTGTIRAEGTAFAIGALDAPLILPSSKPVFVPAGTLRTWWFNVVPNVAGSFSWTAVSNWFAAELTPAW